jgi:formamidopyrimidine-DNA glycosylase
MRRVLVGHRISDVEVVPDPIIFGDTPPEAIVAALKGRTVQRVGRKGKTWWIDCGSPPVLFGHLGMTGWIRELGAHTIRLKEHGEAPLDDTAGRPRFLKLLITTDEGKQISFTDARRLAHVWLGDSPATNKKVSQLGPDALEDLPKGVHFNKLFAKRTAPAKALLMDQTFLSGIGNWVADEVLYMAKIAPKRTGSSLSTSELAKLRKAILHVLQLAVDAGADHEKYPETWMFHHRWGGARGHQKIGNHDIVREQVGGRTTAWVPKVQK